MREKSILLSADSDVSLYSVSKDIWNDFDKLLDDFFNWKRKNIFDETLFVKYLRKRFGEESITFVRIVGEYAGSPNMILLDGKDITEQYSDIKWFNF